MSGWKNCVSRKELRKERTISFTRGTCGWAEAGGEASANCEGMTRRAAKSVWSATGVRTASSARTGKCTARAWSAAAWGAARIPGSLGDTFFVNKDFLGTSDPEKRIERLRRGCPTPAQIR